MISKHRISYR